MLKLFFLLLIILGATLWDASAIALAKTVDFQWVGQKGYSVQGSLTYLADPRNLKLIDPADQKKLYLIEKLTVSFYEPSGKKIQTYENIKNSVSSNPYFQLNFDPTQSQIYGSIDLGGDSAGEVYLKGNINQNLALFKIDVSGKEQIYDQNLGQFHQFQMENLHK